MNKKIEKIKKTKSWLNVKGNRIHSPLARITKEKRETQISCTLLYFLFYIEYIFLSFYFKLFKKPKCLL